MPIELRVDYKKLNTFFADYTKNISKGGTFIKTEKPLPVGTRFVFRLAVPALEVPVELQGEVMWTREPEEEPGEEGAGMGIRFLYDSDETRLGFERLVEGLMRENLGAHISERLLGRPPR